MRSHYVESTNHRSNHRFANYRDDNVASQWLELSTSRVNNKIPRIRRFRFVFNYHGHHRSIVQGKSVWFRNGEAPFREHDDPQTEIAWAVRRPRVFTLDTPGSRDFLYTGWLRNAKLAEGWTNADEIACLKIQTNFVGIFIARWVLSVRDEQVGISPVRRMDDGSKWSIW